MHKIYLLFTGLMIVLLSINIAAQDEQEMNYLFQSKDLKVSGFGAPIMGFSAIQDDFAFFMGGGGAVLFNQTVFLGGYGEGLTTSHYLTLEDAEGEFIGTEGFEGKIEFGHGGLWLGYIHQSKKPIHFGASSKFGWGSIYLNDRYYTQTNSAGSFYDNVFVITPQIEVEFNMATWFKVNIGAGYRFVTGVNEQYKLTDGSTKDIFDVKDFSKPELTINLLFGYFK